VIAGACRRLECKTQPLYQPPVESEDSGSDAEDIDYLKSSEVMPSVSPPPFSQSQVTPIFSRTLNAIQKTVSTENSPSTSSSTQSPPKSQPLKITPQVESREETKAATAGPPPVTRPLSTFARTEPEKEKDTPLAPPPVTVPLSTFARTQPAAVVEPAKKPKEDDPSLANLSGHNLYICCNPGCDFSFEQGPELVDHLTICAFTTPTLFCVHCKRNFKTVLYFITVAFKF